MKKIGLLFPFLLAPLLFNCGGKEPEPTPTVTYNVITTFNHCSSTDAPTEIKKDESLTFHVKADEDYALPESIDVTGCEYVYTKAAQTITISNPTSDVSITVNAPQVIFTYTVTPTFVKCSSADVPEQIKTGQSITFTVTPDKNYVLDPSSISIEGCEYDFDQDNNKITLRDPTKDVTVTIAAKFYAEYPIVYKGADVCTIEPRPEVIHTGETISFTVTPSEGYYLHGVFSDDVTCECETNVKIGYVTISNPIEEPAQGNVTLRFTVWPIEDFTIDYRLTNCEVEGPTTIKRFGTATIHFLPNEHYYYPEVTVRDAESTYDRTTGELVISNPLSRVTIIANSYEEWYSIKFVDIDGTELYSTSCKYLSVPAYPASRPKPQYIDKDRPQDFYEFVGWNPEPYAADKDETYVAQYKVINCSAYVKIHIPAGEWVKIAISGTSATGGYAWWYWQDRGRRDFNPGNFYASMEFAGVDEDVDTTVKIVCEDADNISVSATYGQHWDPLTVKEIYLGKSVTTIPNNAFAKSNVESVIFEENGNLTTVGERAFEGSSNLKSIKLPSTVTSIGGWAFSGCSNLVRVNIPDSVTTIGRSTFAECSKLEEYTCTEDSQLESIGEEAFLNCTSLKKINIPAKLETIATGRYASFINCPSIEEINIDEGNKVFTTKVGDKECNALIKKIDEDHNLLVIGSYKSIINEGITEIGSGAFYGTPIKEVKIPSTVTNIDVTAFDNCSEITSIWVDPANAKYTSRDTNGNECNCIIVNGNTVFKGCYDIVLSEQLTTIGEHAFYGCAKLEELEIPAFVTWINNEAFMGCRNLKSLTFAANSKLVHMGQDSFTRCVSLKEVIIPKSVKTLKDGWVFSQCISLSTVIFEEGSIIDKIGTNTFYDCAIEHIDLPSSLKVIGKWAFDSCDLLTSIKIPSSVTLIDSQAFSNCKSLTKVDLTAFTDVSNIPAAGNDKQPFYNCPEELRLYVSSEEMRDAFIAKGGGWPADPNKYVIGAPSI